MRVFSGLRPTGKLHIGNYLGAVKNWLKLQEEHECIFGVVDYHGMTTPFKPEELKKNTQDFVLDLLAAGIDPEKCSLIIQSQIPQHTELAWILGTITPVSWLEKIPTYKEKIALHPQYVNLGLLSYPVLMAADILIYKANLVPVGEDQLPHIELTNMIAKRFNNMFRVILTNTDTDGQIQTKDSMKVKDFFPEVKPLLTKASRIMSLQGSSKKMSKTGDEGIFLSDSPDEIRRKIKSAVTDSGKEIKFDEEKKPAVSNLLIIYSELSGSPIKEIEKKFDGKNYAEFKKDLAEVIIDALEPFRKKRAELEKNPEYVKEVLTRGRENAILIAEKNLGEVKQKIGLYKN